MSGETQISSSKVPIRTLRLEPALCLPLPQALKAIRAADIITVGPGSLYTSILPNLLVAQVARVIGEARATKIFVNNLMTQPGETDGYSLREHMETIKKYAPEIHFDFVVVNDRRISKSRLNSMPPMALIKSVSTIRLTMRSIRPRRSCALTCWMAVRKLDTTRNVSPRSSSTAANRRLPL